MTSSLALFGCENSSRLDETVKGKGAEQKAGASPVTADHSGSLEERVARLEENYAKYAETLAWVNGIHQQQQQQQQQQERNEPAQDAVFAVDIASNVKLGMVEGSPQALVTIVEAWDFA